MLILYLKHAIVMYPTTQEYIKMLWAQEELGKLSKQGLLLVKDRKGNPIYMEGKDSVILKLI